MSNKPEDILNVPKKIRAKYSKLNDKVLWLYTESKDWDESDWSRPVVKDLINIFKQNTWTSHHYIDEKTLDNDEKNFYLLYTSTCMEREDYENKGFWWCLNKLRKKDSYLAKARFSEILDTILYPAQDTKKSRERIEKFYENSKLLFVHDEHNNDKHSIWHTFFNSALSSNYSYLALESLDDCCTTDDDFQLLKSSLHYYNKLYKLDDWDNNYIKILDFIDRTNQAKSIELTGIIWNLSSRCNAFSKFNKINDEYREKIHNVFEKLLDVFLKNNEDNDNIKHFYVNDPELLSKFLEHPHLSTDNKSEVVNRLLSVNIQKKPEEMIMIVLKYIDEGEVLDIFQNLLKEGKFEDANTLSSFVNTSDVRDRMMLGLVDFFTEKYPKLGSVIQGANIQMNINVDNKKSKLKLKKM